MQNVAIYSTSFMISDCRGLTVVPDRVSHDYLNGDIVPLTKFHNRRPIAKTAKEKVITI